MGFAFLNRVATHIWGPEPEKLNAAATKELADVTRELAELRALRCESDEGLVIDATFTTRP